MLGCDWDEGGGNGGGMLVEFFFSKVYFQPSAHPPWKTASLISVPAGGSTESVEADLTPTVHTQTHTQS